MAQDTRALCESGILMQMAILRAELGQTAYCPTIFKMN